MHYLHRNRSHRTQERRMRGISMVSVPWQLGRRVLMHAPKVVRVLDIRIPGMGRMGRVHRHYRRNNKPHDRSNKGNRRWYESSLGGRGKN